MKNSSNPEKMGRNASRTRAKLPDWYGIRNYGIIGFATQDLAVRIDTLQDDREDPGLKKKVSLSTVTRQNILKISHSFHDITTRLIAQPRGSKLINALSSTNFPAAVFGSRKRGNTAEEEAFAPSYAISDIQL